MVKNFFAGVAAIFVGGLFLACLIAWGRLTIQIASAYPREAGIVAATVFGWLLIGGILGVIFRAAER